MSILRTGYKRLLVSLIFSISAHVFAEANLPQDLQKLETDIVKVGVEVFVVEEDLRAYLINNVPSFGTLLVDGSVDGVLRQYQPLAVAIKKLEDKNLVNGAIVRDLSKALTIIVKIHFELPVDLSGRQYDRADLYAQMIKLMSKAFGFATLYGLGGIENSVLLFIVNNGGDVLSQAVLDAGRDWRKSKTDSFEDYAVDNYSVRKSMVSIPAKGGVSYVMGWLINKFNIADAAELATLVILNQVTRSGLTLTLPNRLSFRIGFPVSFVTSVVKSLILTTTCKSAVDLSNYYVGNFEFSMPSWLSESTDKLEL